MRYNNEITPDTIEYMKAILNQELKYKQLCEALDLHPKSGNAKAPQLRNLGSFCKLEQLDSPTRYVIREVYDEEYKAFLELNERNRYQYYFEAALYQEFLRNGCRPIRASFGDLLLMFKEVNPNFIFSSNPKLLKKISPDIAYMTDISNKIYPILKQWTRRHLQSMEKRFVIIKREGFRLYTKYTTKQGETSFIKHDLEENSELEQKCLEIYYQAAKEIMPPDWCETRVYAPEPTWERFKTRRSQLVKQKIGARFDDVKPIMIITPPTKEWVTNKLLETYEQVEALPAIEAETINKILNTNKLNDFTMNQRKEFISHHIQSNPVINYRQMLR